MATDRSIESTGSLTRDQLANERTFLAWLRTALAFIGLGVVLAKFVDLDTPTRLASLLLIAMGSVMLVYGMIRYRRLSHAIDRGRYLPATMGPMVIGVIGLLVAIVATILVLV
jgi:putative membrane protein